MTIKMRTIQSHYPQTSTEVRGQNVQIRALEAKSSLWQNDLFVATSVKMQLQYDISMRMN